MKKSLNLVLKHPLFAGSFIMIVGSNSVNLLNYLYHIASGRLLGPEKYGELASLISVISLLSVIPASFSLVIIKYVSSAKNSQEIRGLLVWLKSITLKASILVSAVIILFSPFISSFLKIESNFFVILIALLFMFSLSSLILRSVLQGLLKFKEFIITLLAEGMSKFSLTFIILFLGFGVFGALISLVISAIIGFIITIYYLKEIFLSESSSKRPKNLKAMFSYAVPVAFFTISATSLYSSDLILVKHFLSAYDAGIYAALSTLGKIIYFGTAPIGSVMFPLVSKKFSSGEKYMKIFLYSLVSTLIISLSILIVYLFFPDIAIQILYGPSYLNAQRLLIWFGLFITFFTLSSLVISFNLSLGKLKVVIFPFIAAIAQIILIWFFHESLFVIILISNVVSALLLLSLLIYSSYEKKQLSSNTINISNSTSL